MVEKLRFMCFLSSGPVMQSWQEGVSVCVWER